MSHPREIPLGTWAGQLSGAEGLLHGMGTGSGEGTRGGHGGSGEEGEEEEEEQNRAQQRSFVWSHHRGGAEESSCWKNKSRVSSRLDLR